jgi:hypothetical protein
VNEEELLEVVFQLPEEKNLVGKRLRSTECFLHNLFPSLLKENQSFIRI